MNPKEFKPKVHLKKVCPECKEDEDLYWEDLDEIWECHNCDWTGYHLESIHITPEEVK